MPTGERDACGRPVFRRVERTTGVIDRSRALQIALSYERAATAVAEKRWSEDAARQFLTEISVLSEHLPAATCPQSAGNFVVLQLRRGIQTPVLLQRRVLNGREDGLHSFARFIVRRQSFSNAEFAQFVAATKTAAARTGAVTVLVP